MIRKSPADEISCVGISFTPAGRTEDRYGGTFSERRLENAERCVCGSLDAGSGSTGKIEEQKGSLCLNGFPLK